MRGLKQPPGWESHEASSFADDLEKARKLITEIGGEARKERVQRSVIGPDVSMLGKKRTYNEHVVFTSE